MDAGRAKAHPLKTAKDGAAIFLFTFKKQLGTKGGPAPGEVKASLYVQYQTVFLHFSVIGGLARSKLTLGLS